MFQSHSCVCVKDNLYVFDRKFVFFNIPQIQYRNPWVQIMMFKNMTPSPFLRFYLGECFTVSQAVLRSA